jgi:hypothetical protein
MRPLRAPAFLAACLVSATAAAATPTLEIELNKLEPVEGACRAYLVFRNTTEANFASLRLDLVLFGKDGVIARRLAVEAAPLAAGKTSVKLFDVQGLACGDVGQVLLNDIVACRDATGDRNDCANLVKPVSKTGATFSK